MSEQLVTPENVTTKDGKINLLDLNRQQMREFFKDLGEKPFRADQVMNPTCHKGTSSCFGNTAHQWLFLYQLEQLLAERKSADPETSYTAKLYASGTKRIAQKVGEEGVETALAATVHDRFELTNEASDLMYHLLVLLQDQDLDLTTVIENLRKRHQ